MEKKRSVPLDFIQYGGLKAFIAIIRLLPLSSAMWVGRSIVSLGYLIDRKRRAIAKENLRSAYGDDLSDSQIEKIIRGVYRHLASVGIDFIKLPRVVKADNWQNYFEVEGLEFIRKARAEGKGVILVTGHVGNWEVLGYAFEFFFHQPVYSVAKHMENPFVDKLFTKLREEGGQKIIFTENASREIIKVLKGNKLLGILVDQNAKENSVFVNFFGQKAATTRAAATLSLKMGVPIIMLFARKIAGHFRFKISVNKPIEIEKTGNLETDIFNLTQKYTTIIESRIREHPHEWLWIHRRWKTRPH